MREELIGGGRRDGGRGRERRSDQKREGKMEWCLEERGGGPAHGERQKGG